MAKKSTGMFGSAGRLFFVARSAYEQTKEPSSGKGAGLWETLVAVVFSAAALEAFINEAAEIAAMSTDPKDRLVETFAKLMEEVEEARGSINLKFLLAKAIFAGKTYDKGEQRYQDFKQLMGLRNALVHMKADKFELDSKGGTSRKPLSAVQYLQTNKILAKVQPGTLMDWISLISTPEVARWACNVTVEMIQSIIEILPESHFQRVQKSTAKAFQPVM
jgi:hypothetical protein